jgi:hypothetical protein
MPRETADLKAQRLLLAGRVRVVRAAGRDVQVLVEGDHGTLPVVPPRHAKGWGMT